MSRVPLTPQGFRLIQDELKQLKTVERGNIIDAIEQARALGDLSENAEYQAAKEKQSFIEGRIAELEDKISRADIIDITKLSGDTVKFGAKVTILDEDTDEVLTYQIVGADEADIKKGQLSITSPLARALIGKSKKSIVDVKTPRGDKSYEIKEIKFEADEII